MDDVQVTHVDVTEVPEVFGVADESGEVVVLLDVRESDEWANGHAAGAQHIPLGDVPSRYSEIDPDAKLYVICHAGGRSLKAAQWLARNGYEPVNVTGGMLAWAGAGRAMVTDADA